MLVNILIAINTTLMYAAPLIFAAMGGVISERSGVINLGIEGMMTIGALVGATVGYYSQSAWLGFFAAGLAGALLALLHAVAAVTLRCNQTVSGVAINFIGQGGAIFLARFFFDGATMTKPVPNKLPKLFPWLLGNQNPVVNTINYDITILLAVGLAVLLWYVLYKTKWGLRIRAVGEHPAAADTMGVNVYAVRYICVLLSGLFAGFGGAAMTLAVVSLFSPTVISGHGFIALAAVIFGKWTPQGAVASCMLFGFAQALVVLLGGGALNVPTQVLSMLPYILTIFVLILFVGKSVAPKADGLPYEKGSR